MSDLLIALAVWICLLASSLPLLYLLATTLAALFPKRGHIGDGRIRRIVILIPAHNEALLIAGTVADALRQNYPAGASAVFVVADNCSDDTADLARNAGGRVLERRGNPGKGQGLYDALALLMQEDWDAFLIMDADSRLHRDTLKAINEKLAEGSPAVQIRYGVLNPTDSIRTYAMELSTASFNALRPLGKSVLGISAGINGNGFCITHATVERVPYLAHSIVEDIEYHMLLLKAGLRVDFLDQVWVKAQMPIGGRGSEVQRIRWERGRVATIKTYASGLFRELLRGQRRALDGLIDVLMPPVSLVFLGLLPALAVGDTTQRALAIGGVAILAVHYALAAWCYGSLKGLLLLIGYIPWYVVWKSYVVIASMITEKNLPWVRTDRHQHEDKP